MVAHRGAGLDAPENTLESLRLCKKKGAKCVEFDVALTLDNVAVVFHDDTVDRVSDKKGHIDQMTFDQVRTCTTSRRLIGCSCARTKTNPKTKVFVRSG